jgi:hypothetical protein
MVLIAEFETVELASPSDVVLVVLVVVAEAAHFVDIVELVELAFVVEMLIDFELAFVDYLIVRLTFFLDYKDFKINY